MARTMGISILTEVAAARAAGARPATRTTTHAESTRDRGNRIEQAPGRTGENAAAEVTTPATTPTLGHPLKNRRPTFSDVGRAGIMQPFAPVPQRQTRGPP